MKTNKKNFDGEGYLRMYPQLNKWINQCVACQTNGYKPEMPESTKNGFKNIRKFFNELPLKNGLCESCANQ